ncbi:uncharacterized protein [Antedon mediterranea]|uniref:uncharacterized protein n=1 Tax=Antedon mediterranea TaxID=105859 RepID=UPI003AF71464
MASHEDSSGEEGLIPDSSLSMPECTEGPFIGRKVRLKQLYDLLKKGHDDGVATIYISGLPGMGKTRLAKEAYRQMKNHELLFVDLRELSSTESIINAVLHKIGVHSTAINIDVLILKLKEYRPEKAGGAVLLLANADFSHHVYKNFVKLLERIVACGNTCLKVVITTTKRLPRKLSRYQCVENISINELEYKDARDILQYYAGQAISDEEAERLVHICGKCPLTLKLTGSLLADNIISPKKMIAYLDKRPYMITQMEFDGDVKLEDCYINIINSLPDNQKFHMIRLATVPGTFTRRAAMAILSMKKSELVDVIKQLQDLKDRNLIETSIGDLQRYGMHLPMRQSLQKIGQTDESVKCQYEVGEQEFIGYFLQKLIKIGELSESKYKKAMKRRNKDTANFQELLKLLPKKERSVTTDEWRVISTTVELFFSTKERLKFFKAQRELEYTSKNILQFVEMSAYESLQMSKMNYRYEEILPLLETAEEELLKTKKPEETLPTIPSVAKLFKWKPEQYFAAKHVSFLTDAEKETLILLYQLWGNVCTTCLKDLDQANVRIGVAYDLLKELDLQNTNTARFYSTMADLILTKSRLQQSNALCKESEVKKALNLYRKAYELRVALTQSEHHPDIPVYLANIGSCYYQLEDSKNAIEYYKRSLNLDSQLEDNMDIDNEEAYLKTLRNLALAYRDENRFKEAIYYAEKCASRRRKLLGIHTDTARTYYLLGLFYYERNHRGDMRSAEENFNEALNIEGQLWKQGKPHSVDWENLKRKIQSLLARTEQKMKYSEYKLRFDIAEKKSTQKPKETVISDNNSTTESSDESVDEIKNPTYTQHAYKQERRDVIAEKPLKPTRTVISDADPINDSVVDESKMLQNMEDIKSKHHSNSSASDEGDTRSVASRDTGISSNASSNKLQVSSRPTSTRESDDQRKSDDTGYTRLEMASREDKLSDLLLDFSKLYCGGGKYKWLKCLLFNALSVSTLTDSTSSLELLRNLREGSNISFNNVEILLEIANLTGLDAAIKLVEKYKQNTTGYNAISGKRVIILYRRKLFECLRDVGGSELPRIAAFYTEDSSDYKDIWDFVFFLEVEKRLDSTPEKSKRFAKLLNQTAAYKLTKEYADTLPVTAEPQNISSPSIREVLPGTAAVKKEQSISAVVKKPTVPSSTGNRNSKPWTSSGIALPESDYLRLLVNVSSWWTKHNKINLLKFILLKFKKDVALTDIEKTDDPFDLFELLTAPGIIGPSNVDVLMEAVVIGRMKGVDEEKITKLIPTFPGFTNITVPASWDKRQKLIRFGLRIGKAEQTRIGQLCGVMVNKLPDVWALMFKLENKELFDRKVTELIQRLNDTGMDKLAALLE